MYYLITVNHDGSITYVTSGTRYAMQKLNKQSFHRVTTISDYSKAKRKYGV